MSSGHPPTQAIINLDIADLVFNSLLLPPAAWIAWKHGKAGMVCWPILISFFPARIIADVYQIVNRSAIEMYNQVAIMTNSGSLACLSLAIIGLVYEANVVLPQPKKTWTDKIILGITHLFNTGGIALATYGGAPSPKGGLMNSNFNVIGNLMMLFVMFTVCGWMWPTFKRVNSYYNHPNFTKARWLLRTCVVAMPFQIVRLAYGTTYALNPTITSLDPIIGSFATRFVLLFLVQLCVAITLVAGGWVSMGTNKPGQHTQVEEEMGLKTMPSNATQDSSAFELDNSYSGRSNMAPMHEDNAYGRR